MIDNRRVTDANTKTRFVKSEMTYNEMAAAIQTVPKSWVPELLRTVVESGYLRGGIFTAGEASIIAIKAEQKAKQEIQHEP